MAARIAKTVRACGLRALVLIPAVILSLSLMHEGARAQAIKGEASLNSANGYARLVLKFDQDVATEAVIAGGILVIRFKNPVDVPVDKLSDAVPAYVGSVRRDPDGMAIRMALVQKISVNLMAAGERVFIDLLPEKWTGLPPSLPADVVRELSERALAAERALRLQKIADEANKKPPIRVRASVQPTFVRFVFEMPEGVAISSSFISDTFSLAFSAPLVFDLADAKIAMPSNIKSINQKIEGEVSHVDISVIGEVDVRAFREDKNYVVDIGFQQSEKSAQQIIAPHDGSVTKMVEQRPVMKAPEPAKASEDSPPHSNSEAVAKSPSETKAAAEPMSVAPATEIPAVEKPVAAVAEEKVATPAMMQPPQTAADPPMAGPMIVAEAKRTSDDLRLIFPFGEPVAGASFRRSDSIWIVFDTDKRIDTSAIIREGASLIGEATNVKLPTGIALRLKLLRPQLTAFAGDERGWTLTLADKVQSPSQPLTVMRNIADPAHANVSIALAQPGMVHRLEDPDAGNSWMIVTAQAPARGLMKRQNFVEFSLLESQHGIVIQPNAEDITAEISSDKAVLGRPGGLMLSAAMTSPDRASSVARSIFDVNEWRDYRDANFNDTRDKLFTLAAQSTGEQRVPAHVDLARFYLSRGFYPEAKGILDLAFSEVQRGEEDPAALIVHAVASTLFGRPEQALKDLANPAVGTNFDSQIWKALALARLGRWADAREKFKNVEFAITSLPVELQRIVIVDAMSASLEVKDYSGASTRSNDLDVVGVGKNQAAQVALMRGRLALELGREKDALTEFGTAAASDNRPIAAEAKLFDISLRAKRNELGEDDAITELETASMLWRGDSVEVRNLEMLAHLYAAKGRYGESFTAARNATKLQPNSELSRKAQDESSALFEQIFNGSKGDDLPPVDALAMFYEYRELTPIGRKGDEMIRRLADRLVNVDLLDQASELLQYQIDKRLEGAARAQVATRLAMIYLMNRKPDRAIAALRTTRIADLAGELRQQRLLLESRAQSDIGRYDLALDIVSNVNGREAIRLRSDIYWAARRWRESAEQIELLYGNRWKDFEPLTTLEKSDIIRAAIAYALAEDAVGLARFHEKYSSKMDGDDREAFELAGKPSSANSADFARIAKMAATIDTLDGFLREMKTRFPDAVARAKLPPELKVDPNPTGSLPEIVGLKRTPAAR